MSDGAVDKRSDKPKAQKIKKEAPERAVGEFTNFLQSVRNGTGAKNDLSSVNPPLAETTDLESDGRPRLLVLLAILPFPLKLVFRAER